jgi:chromosome segregation ATPase
MLNIISIMKRIFFILLFLFSTELSFAEVYKWVDEKGVVHFTDDIIQIPEKYRPQIERLGPSEEKVDTKIEGKSSTNKKEGTYRDRIGRDEGYWKGQVEEWNKKLKDAQERVNNLRTKYNEFTEKFNDSKSSAERINIRKERDQIKNEIEKYKTQIEEAKYMLEKKIPEEAEIFKAKPEWIKQ